MSTAARRSDPRIRTFQRIARIYDLFFPLQYRAYRRIFGSHHYSLGLPLGARILEIGCGPGALTSVLDALGYEVWAVDAAPAMVGRARRRLTGSSVRLWVGDALDGLPFPDRHFDLVLAAHVVHGFSASERGLFYREARRLSRGPVLLHDFPPRAMQGLLPDVKILEALERSDYRRFTRDGAREMAEVFGEVEVFVVAVGSAWYIGGPRAGPEG